MRPEVECQGPIIHEWIHPVGKSVQMNRDESVRVGASADDRTEPKLHGIRCCASHHYAGAGLRQKIAQPETHLKHGIALVETGGPRRASGRMTRINCNGETAKRVGPIS